MGAFMKRSNLVGARLDVYVVLPHDPGMCLIGPGGAWPGSGFVDCGDRFGARIKRGPQAHDAELPVVSH